MVAVPVCPTHQPAGAAWYRWFTQSVSSDTSMTLSTSRVYDSLQRVIDSQLNRWSLRRREGLVQRPLVAAPVRRC
jgi:hypothetical protein